MPDRHILFQSMKRIASSSFLGIAMWGRGLKMGAPSPFLIPLF